MTNSRGHFVARTSLRDFVAAVEREMGGCRGHLGGRTSLRDPLRDGRPAFPNHVAVVSATALH